MLASLLGFFSSDIAIDLGTANTLVYVKGRGVVLNQPSVVAVYDNRKNRHVLAVGEEAKTMIGKAPRDIYVIRPLKDGVIADFQVAEDMIKAFIRRIHNRSSFFAPRIVICVPSGATTVERRAIQEAAELAGGRDVFLIEEPMAAAIGSGLPVNEPGGNMIVDIGGGTTEVAVVSLGGVVYSCSIRVGGDKMDTDIVNYIRRHHSVVIGEPTAEEIKKKIGSAYFEENDPILEMEVKGRDMFGAPKSFLINSSHVESALRESTDRISDAVQTAFANAAPELAVDIITRGIMLTGGGALLHNLDKALRRKLGLPVVVADNPLECVVKGTGIAVENIKKFRYILSKAV